MADSYTEVTSKSWFGRIGDSFKGILFGIVLFIGSMFLLFWNEGRTIKTLRSLEEGQKIVVSVKSDNIDNANEGKLIHLSGMATTEETLTDDIFNISVNAIKLQRKVKMYQWVEKEHSSTKKKMGGGEETTTTYNYNKEWADTIVSSSNFKHPEGHANPDSMPYLSEEKAAQRVTLGAFTLSSVFISKICSFEPVPVSKQNEVESFQVFAGGLFRGKNSQQPEIGDIKITFSVVKPATVSIIGQQSNGVLDSYLAKSGKQIDLLQMGNMGAEAMFEAAKQENTLICWGLRFLGFFLMLIGLNLVFKPLSVLADLIPFVGSVVNFGTGMVSLMISFPLSLCVIAAAWFYYRPVLSVGIILVAVGSVIFFCKTFRKNNADLKGKAPLPGTPAGEGKAE